MSNNIERDNAQRKQRRLNRNMYINNKCRCDDCQTANSVYMRKYKQKGRLA